MINHDLLMYNEFSSTGDYTDRFSLPRTQQGHLLGSETTNADKLSLRDAGRTN